MGDGIKELVLTCLTASITSSLAQLIAGLQDAKTRAANIIGPYFNIVGSDLIAAHLLVYARTISFARPNDTDHRTRNVWIRFQGIFNNQLIVFETVEQNLISSVPILTPSNIDSDNDLVGNDLI